MLQLAVCDDDAQVIEQIETYIERIEDIRLEYDVFFSAEELDSYLQNHEMRIDVFILDIEMGAMSGLELAKRLRKLFPFALIIFMTDYPGYVYEVFDVVTFDFVIKPLSFEHFSKMIHRAADFLRLTKTNFIFSYRRVTYSIQCRSLSYIEKEGRKAYIYTNDGEVHQCNITLSEIWEQLDGRMFVQIRVSCIVNLAEISEITGESVALRDGTILYMGRNYKKKVRSRHREFVKSQM